MFLKKWPQGLKLNSDDLNLVLVYNGDQGIANGFMDSLHKKFAPETYECSLCKLTHGFLRAHQEWSDFVKSIKVPLHFFHRNEVKNEAVFKDVELPIILKIRKGFVEDLIDKETMNQIKDLSELIELIKEKVSV